MMANVNKGSIDIEKAKLIASYLFSLSLFALAGSIVYFTFEMAVISKQVPDVLVRIDATSEKIEPALDEVASVVALVPLILKEIEETRKQIPPILEEIKLTRMQIPAVLNEVEQTRIQIPAVLDEVALVRKQVPAILDEVEAVRNELPAVLDSTDKVSDAVVLISQEIKITRESVPPMMDRADVLIEKARVAGKEASQGAVTGIFKGIITAPFVLIGDAGRSIAGISEEDAKEYTERDFDLIEQASLELLNAGSTGDERKWENAESGNHGVITLAEISEEGVFSNECRVLRIQLFEKDKDKKIVDRTICRNDEEKWEIDE